MNNLFDKKELWTKRLELILDVQTSLCQLANGQGIAHRNAKNKVLKRVHR